MENNNDGVIRISRHNSHPKVHSSMCNQLTMMLDKVSSVLPAIEAAQPGCKAGIEELCNLYNIVDKGKLAITGEATAMRCERIRIALRRSLFLVQNMVADVHNDLADVKFTVNLEEEEAGKAILEMLQQSDATQEHELQTFLFAASKLNLTSAKSILIERRAIKKLLDKINGNDPKKEGILKFFQYLVRKYGKSMKPESAAKNEAVDVANVTSSTDLFTSGTNAPQKCFSPTNSWTRRCEDQNNLSRLSTPSEFCCPLSMKLMYDPVIIASGQTYERENIERWFSEGHDICPRTQIKLENFTITPNTCMKTVICNWCKDNELEFTSSSEQFHSYSLSSLHNISAPLISGTTREYMSDHSSSSLALSATSYVSSPMRETEESRANYTQFFSNAYYQLYLSFSNFNKEMFLNFFYELSELPMELQAKAVKDFKSVLNGECQIWHSMISNGFLEAFLEFLKNDNGRCTMEAQRTGIQFFLAFLRNSRTRIPSISEDAVHLIASFLDSELKTEALQMLHELLQQPTCWKSHLIASVVAPSVFLAWDSADTGCLELVLKIICELSSKSDVKSFLISSGIISKLSAVLSEGSLPEYCLKILLNLSEGKQAADLIIRTDQCLSSISDYLDTGSSIEREHASGILLALCSRSIEDCVLVMKEGVIPALVDLSVNGTEVAKASSIKLLQLLRDSKHSDQFGNSCSSEVAVNGAAENSPNGTICKQPISKSARYISRKLNIFSKPRSLTLV
uniref:RING-type E3 ubiquitin transferase n=1 Tax=Leersia perrieri TaxID=77586 RepID=A0A0D9WQ56_9ORYZ